MGEIIIDYICENAPCVIRMSEVYSISVGLGRVTSIYHGTVGRECYQILLLLCYVIL